jgi:hypothetical protein
VSEDAKRAARDRMSELYVERFGNVVSEENSAELLREMLADPELRPIVLTAYPELESSEQDD